MQNLGSYTDMFNSLEKNGWTAKPSTRGVTFTLDENFGSGTMMLWGNSNSFGFVDLDITYKNDNITVNFSENIGVQITFIEQNEMEYYKDESDALHTFYGTFFYINNAPMPWFKKYPKQSRVKALTLMISDEFLRENGIDISILQWNNLARAINTRNISIPQIATILKQIRYAEIDEELFPHYFKNKTVEAFLLLLNYSKSQEYSLSRINSKSQNAVKNTVDLLCKNYISPPIITDIAKAMGIDKKTLQSSFKEIVGLSIHKYIRSLKMQHALTLLKTSDMSIENIAKEVGYNSKIHFYRAFDEVFSMKPTEMRALLN